MAKIGPMRTFHIFARRSLDGGSGCPLAGWYVKWWYEIMVQWWHEIIDCGPFSLRPGSRKHIGHRSGAGLLLCNPWLTCDLTRSHQGLAGGSLNCARIMNCEWCCDTHHRDRGGVTMRCCGSEWAVCFMCVWN